MSQELSRTATQILSFVSFLDSYGASTWNLRVVAGISAAILLFVRKKIGVKCGIEWHAFLHAIVTAIGSAACLYLNVYASETMTGGLAEPFHSARCGGALTSLHRIVPAITWGYSICDVLDSFEYGPAFFMHGFSTALVMGTCCELGMSHMVAPLLIMEMSTVVLSTVRVKHFGIAVQVCIQLLFAVSFFIFRIIIFPRLWWESTKALYMVNMSEEHPCFPTFFVYFVLLFGTFFNILNFYWFIKIIKKILRKATGQEKTDDVEMVEKKKT